MNSANSIKKYEIKPVTCYANGKQVIASYLNVVSVSDNLFNKVIFKYTFFDATSQQCGEAAFELNGVDDYKTWDASIESAYKIVGAAIGIVFVVPFE